MIKGTITQIIGVVVDAHFNDKLPDLYTALETKLQDGKKLVLEVQRMLASLSRHIRGSGGRQVVVQTSSY